MRRRSSLRARREWEEEDGRERDARDSKRHGRAPRTSSRRVRIRDEY